MSNRPYLILSGNVLNNPKIDAKLLGFYAKLKYAVESGEGFSYRALTATVNASQPTISKMLKTLEELGLIARTKDGNRVCYSFPLEEQERADLRDKKNLTPYQALQFKKPEDYKDEDF